ncbi:hypothetical protein EVJ58_g9253 [Rhodofomes roseus]|uniref:Transmembrane protein n=1 Tax=Rhodofomes roseus TaxID=34475 RepID=A0A4Y9XYW9_9APHY|nr:hypothetical protein EVJ58_g9253 [Rhodofomes roseus]
MFTPGLSGCVSAAVVLTLSRSVAAQSDSTDTAFGSSSSARTIAGAIIGVLLGLLVVTFVIVVVRRHQRIYGRPQVPSVELRRVSSYVSVFTRRQNAELGVRDQGPGYAAPPYVTQPPPYTGPENQGQRPEDSKQDMDLDLELARLEAVEGVGGLGYDEAPLPAKDGMHGGSVDVVDARGRYEYDVPPPSPSTLSSASTPPPPPTPTDEPIETALDAWYKGLP